MSTSALMGPVLLGVGAGFGLLGGGIVLQARRFRRRGRRAQGQIVRLRTRRSHHTTMYYSTVRFTTEQGRQVEAEARFGSSPPPGRPGEHVPIVYDPARPGRVRVDSAWSDGTLHGGIFLAAGIAAFAMWAGMTMNQVS
ncbi:DUF3592 domain-containing protein [Microbispora sp. H10836]|uniref:DUF3592 domain-containing protein n=1 Tax=Microbispora sp. H10836 TaxID=2729106 RepID=UPI00147385A8|nr:DUF3592 domain-containing protein [Microbispora sp. H10836]